MDYWCGHCICYHFQSKRRTNMYISTRWQHYSFYLEPHCNKTQLVSGVVTTSLQGLFWPDLLLKIPMTEPLSTHQGCWRKRACISLAIPPANLLGRDWLWKKNCLIKCTWRIFLEIPGKLLESQFHNHVLLHSTFLNSPSKDSWNYRSFTLISPDHLWDKRSYIVRCSLEAVHIRIQMGPSKPLLRLFSRS